MSEIQKQGWPNRIDVIPGIDRIRSCGEFLGKLLRFLPQNAPYYMSDHYRAETGASAMLDRSLDNIQGEWPFEV